MHTHAHSLLFTLLLLGCCSPADELLQFGCTLLRWQRRRGRALLLRWRSSSSSTSTLLPCAAPLRQQLGNDLLPLLLCQGTPGRWGGHGVDCVLCMCRTSSGEARSVLASLCSASHGGCCFSRCYKGRSRCLEGGSSLRCFSRLRNRLSDCCVVGLGLVCARACTRRCHTIASSRRSSW